MTLPEVDAILNDVILPEGMEFLSLRGERVFNLTDGARKGFMVYLLKDQSIYGGMRTIKLNFEIYPSMSREEAIAEIQFVTRVFQTISRCSEHYA